MKNEIFYGFEKNYPSFDAFSKAAADYIDYHSNRRIQAKTKWMPPSKFREASISEALNYSQVSRKLGIYQKPGAVFV